MQLAIPLNKHNSFWFSSNWNVILYAFIWFSPYSIFHFSDKSTIFFTMLRISFSYCSISSGFLSYFKFLNLNYRNLCPRLALKKVSKRVNLDQSIFISFISMHQEEKIRLISQSIPFLSNFRLIQAFKSPSTWLLKNLFSNPPNFLSYSIIPTHYYLWNEISNFLVQVEANSINTSTRSKREISHSHPTR